MGFGLEVSSNLRSAISDVESLSITAKQKPFGLGDGQTKTVWLKRMKFDRPLVLKRKDLLQETNQVIVYFPW